MKRTPHLVWNPVKGEIAQLLPPSRAACGLPGGQGRHGRVCLQIQVIGSVHEPFTDTGLDGLDRILGWLDSWAVPRRWPAGPPLAYPDSVADLGNARLWAQGGHFGHSQVPGADGGDPGKIDIARISGDVVDAVAVPRPREELKVLNPAM